MDPKQMKAKKNQILSVLLKTYENEGIEGFFKGFGANMTATFSMRTSLSHPLNVP
jgi:hypothetical protein